MSTHIAFFVACFVSSALHALLLHHTHHIHPSLSLSLSLGGRRDSQVSKLAAVHYASLSPSIESSAVRSSGGEEVDNGPSGRAVQKTRISAPCLVGTVPFPLARCNDRSCSSREWQRQRSLQPFLYTCTLTQRSRQIATRLNEARRELRLGEGAPTLK